MLFKVVKIQEITSAFLFCIEYSRVVINLIVGQRKGRNESRSQHYTAEALAMVSNVG